jgi:hypothetical protein
MLPEFFVTGSERRHANPAADTPVTTTDAAPPTAPERPHDTRRERRRDLAALVAVAIVLRLPSFFAARHLTFDDGVFGASAVAMRNGGVPFRDVFSSQGPLFLPLVWVGDTIGLHTLNGPRLTTVCSGVALVIVLYLAGREVSDRLGGLVAGGLAAVTGSSLAVTSSLAADGPAMALASGAVLVALRYRRDPTTGRAVLMGVLLGAALCVKALVLPAAVPIGLILLFGRRPWHWLTAVGSAVAVGLGSSLVFGFADVWDQSVIYHLDSPGGSDPMANLSKVINTLVTRDPLVLVLGATALELAIVHRRRGQPTRPAPEGDHPPLDGARRRPGIPLLLGLWTVAMFLMLVTEHPMWRPHVSEMVPPLALLIATYRPAPKPMAVVTAIVLPLSLVFAWGAIAPLGYRGDEAQVVRKLEALPAGALAISDEPGQVWRAGRLTPDWLVDTSVLRTDSDRPSLYITTDTVLEDAARPDVCAVVLWTPRFREALDGLDERLLDAGYRLDATYHLNRRLYLKEDCRP